MIYVGNFNLWMIVMIISQVSAVSYNKPKFYSNTSWNSNAITFANSSAIGLDPYDIFINTKNTIYALNQDSGQIVVWYGGNATLTTNSFGNLSNPYSLFVTTSDDIYVDTFNSMGGVSKWTLNSTNGVLTMKTCHKCWDLFVDVSNTLYCSLDGRHQVITKLLNNGLNILAIVAGTGSADSASNTLDNPRGIFVNNNSDLYVADCGNNRIQLFSFGKLHATTVAGSGSSTTTITLNCPTGIILDADDYLFIVDSGNNRITGSGSSGFRCLVGCSRTSGSASNQLNNPWSISFDSYGNIFVTDQNNNRIQKFLQATDSFDTTTKQTITSAMHNVQSLSTDKPSTVANNPVQATTARSVVVITQAGDPIISLYNTTAGGSTGGSSATCSNSAESVCNAIDNDTSTKYLNYGVQSGGITVNQPGLNTGFFVSPTSSNASIAIALLFATANDSPTRDPITVTLEGTNVTTYADLNLGFSWTLIYSGPTGINVVTAPPRQMYVSQQNFPNTCAFRSYRLLVTSQRSNSNSVQYAEAHIIGYI